MRITYSLREADVLAWRERANRTSPRSSTNWWILVVAAVLSAGLGAWQTPAFFFWLAVGALVLALHPKEAIPDEVLGVRSVTLEETGVRIHSPRYRRLIFWDACQSFEEDEHNLYLPFSPQGILIIPRRAFPSTEACTEFRQELIRRSVWGLRQMA